MPHPKPGHFNLEINWTHKRQLDYVNVVVLIADRAALPISTSTSLSTMVSSRDLQVLHGYLCYGLVY
jgi:hypothetical protein